MLSLMDKPSRPGGLGEPGSICLGVAPAPHHYQDNTRNQRRSGSQRGDWKTFPFLSLHFYRTELSHRPVTGECKAANCKADNTENDQDNS
jgi:hypothetical protein